MRYKLICLMAVLTMGWAAPAVQADDFMDVDVSQVDPRFQQAFRNAEIFWESRIAGYSSELPRAVRSQLGKLRITASSPMIDGPGGILGLAAPTQNVVFGGFSSGYFPGRVTPNIAIAQRSMMQFDIDDLPGLAANGSLNAVIRHEMAHAIGLGSLWTQNDLLAVVTNGQMNFVGRFAVAAYRKESGNTLIRYVPVEQSGGSGTALAHWEDDDPFFNRRATTGQAELMLGSIDPDNDIIFVSETTWASMADLWLSVRGVNFVNGDSTGRPSGRTGTGWVAHVGPVIFAGFGQ